MESETSKSHSLPQSCDYYKRLLFTIYLVPLFPVSLSLSIFFLRPTTTDVSASALATRTESWVASVDLHSHIPTPTGVVAVVQVSVLLQRCCWPFLRILPRQNCTGLSAVGQTAFHWSSVRIWWEVLVTCHVMCHYMFSCMNVVKGLTVTPQSWIHPLWNRTLLP